MEVARYYIHKRNIPDTNLVIIPMPLVEEIDWPTFATQIYNPLLEHLVRKNWITGDPSTRVDEANRYLYALYGNNMDYLVVCMDVPLKIKNDPSLIPESLPSMIKTQYLTTQASVDSELALLPFPKTQIFAFVDNPLFKKLNPGRFSLGQVLRISRLDGPSLSDVIGMIDNALIAEERGLMGRAYIDFGNKYAQGDEWLDETRKVVTKLGFSESVDNEDALFGWSDRFDAPALYFGWHSGSPTGPISDPSFRFPPGALAIHIHSYSAGTVRSTKNAWVGPLVSRGITGTVGNVYEPYLPLTHHPHLFLDALEAGKTFGEAAYYAQPKVSWQTIIIGDPLYAPFKVSLEKQLVNAEEHGFIPYAQYAVIRKMRLMRNVGDLRSACDFGWRLFMKQPGMALAYEIALYYWELGEQEKAFQILESLNGMTVFNVEEQGLASEIARFLHKNGARRMALVLYEKLLNDQSLNVTVAKLILPDAVSLATALDRRDLVNSWREFMKANGIEP